MGKRIRVSGALRKEIDEDKLALAFLLLAKSIHEQRNSETPADDDGQPSAQPEAA